LTINKEVIVELQYGDNSRSATTSNKAVGLILRPWLQKGTVIAHWAHVNQR